MDFLLKGWLDSGSRLQGEEEKRKQIGFRIFARNDGE
jgi:hypothetical protein